MSNTTGGSDGSGYVPIIQNIPSSAAPGAQIAAAVTTEPAPAGSTSYPWQLSVTPTGAASFSAASGTINAQNPTADVTVTLASNLQSGSNVTITLTINTEVKNAPITIT